MFDGGSPSALLMTIIATAPEFCANCSFEVVAQLPRSIRAILPISEV